NTRLTKKQRQDVWSLWIGSDVGQTECPLCQASTITQGDCNWHCGHIHAQSQGGSLDLLNLRPICAGCNQSMKTTNMKDYCQNVTGAINRLCLTYNENNLSLMSTERLKRLCTLEHLQTTNDQKTT